VAPEAELGDERRGLALELGDDAIDAGELLDVRHRRDGGEAGGEELADVRGVYSVQFAANGVVEDLGTFDLGADVAGIVAGIGV
jgi:hypothetical protein